MTEYFDIERPLLILLYIAVSIFLVSIVYSATQETIISRSIDMVDNGNGTDIPKTTTIVSVTGAPSNATMPSKFKPISQSEINQIIQQRKEEGLKVQQQIDENQTQKLNSKTVSNNNIILFIQRNMILFIDFFLLIIIIWVLIWSMKKRRKEKDIRDTYGEGKTPEQIAKELLDKGYNESYVEEVYIKLKGGK